jgi:hypothetical protein
MVSAANTVAQEFDRFALALEQPFSLTVRTLTRSSAGTPRESGSARPATAIRRSCPSCERGRDKSFFIS